MRKEPMRTPIIIDLDSVTTEGDVEQKIILPLLSAANYLEIPSANIKAKGYLSPTSIDKLAGKTGGYYPDFSVWENALPLMIVEAKAPEVAAEIGYREAALYARHLNQVYRSGVNPCHFIISVNGTRLLAGAWDSLPEFDVLLSDLRIESKILRDLKEFCGHQILAQLGRKFLEILRPARSVRPFNVAGGQALLTSKKPFNTFAAELAPALRRYFTSSSQNNDREIYERGYVSTDDVTEYDRVLESLLKDRIFNRKGTLTETLTPSRSTEPTLSKRINDLRTASGTEGQLQLITGGVGAGKSLFIRRYKELLQPKGQSQWAHWVFIDFNTAPPSLGNAENWLCNEFVARFCTENPAFDPYHADNLSRVFSRDIQKRKGIYDELAKISSDDSRRQRIQDIQGWQNDPLKMAFGICDHFIGQRNEVVIVVMDNVDRLDLENQLAVFQLSLWFMSQSRAFIVLQMRDETYERFKGRPPLDTYRSGVVFHITPPRFLDVVKRRLELTLEHLVENADKHLEYTLGNGARISYPSSMLGEFLKSVYLELFERKVNVSRVLQGIAGRDVRRALEMFVSILNSGHLTEDAITSQAKGAGEIAIPEYTILKILMRTEYRFFSDVSGFVSNIFYFDNGWEQPNNFLIPEILFWLCANRKVRGDIGLEGYFSGERIADELQLSGYVRKDVISACSWLLQNQLIEADHMNLTGVSLEDSVKVTASGFIHLRILCQRLEYLYGVLTVTPIFERGVADKIADFVNRENQHDRLSASQTANCVEVFLQYLKFEHARLRAAYPNFGQSRSGATYVIEQIEDALRHFRNPNQTPSRQITMLDE